MFAHMTSWCEIGIGKNNHKMCSLSVLCPLCSHLSFENIDTLRISLIKAANGPISCPQCNDSFLGLDKLTIHLFSHMSSKINNELNPEKFLEASSSGLTEISTAPQVISFEIPDVSVASKYKYQTSQLTSDQNNLKVLNASGTTRFEIQLENQYPKNDPQKDVFLQKNCIPGQQCYDNLFLSNTLPSHFDQVPGTQGATGIVPESSPDLSLNLIVPTRNIKLNESTKIWECDTCTKSFTTKYFLKKHKRLHTGEMPYSCEICGKTFTFQQSYHKHLLYHSQEKPHVCQTCQRAFKELSTLHNHERIHSGEKPYKCEICGKCFRQRVSFLVHTRIHTGVMPYKCVDCQKKFRYKLSLRTHKCSSQVTEKVTGKDNCLPMIPNMIPDQNSASNFTSLSACTITSDLPNSTQDSLADFGNIFKNTNDMIQPFRNVEIACGLETFGHNADIPDQMVKDVPLCPANKFLNTQIELNPASDSKTASPNGMINDSNLQQYFYEISKEFL